MLCRAAAPLLLPSPSRNTPGPSGAAAPVRPSSSGLRRVDSLFSSVSVLGRPEPAPSRRTAVRAVGLRGEDASDGSWSAGSRKPGAHDSNSVLSTAVAAVWFVASVQLSVWQPEVIRKWVPLNRSMNSVCVGVGMGCLCSVSPLFTFLC
ncbi:hypothetical protein AAHA92_10018 [Salvia divinorum]|uniref:Uncharacterized protein n=1 Tax=Salvia divinorum TaxID=28513 RepID=A0ABD1HXB2_SALDI